MRVGTPSRPRLSGNRGKRPEVEVFSIRQMTRTTWLVLGLALVAPPSPAQSPGVRFEDIAHPTPGAWPTYDGSLSGNRFSPLNQINTSNVQKLAPKWRFTIQDAPRALEGTPVVV